MTCTKSAIVDSIVEQSGFNKYRTVQIVETLLETIKRSLESGDNVLISGFGKFCVKDKAARKGRNPATGKSMMLNPRRVIIFRCSGKLRDQINN